MRFKLNLPEYNTHLELTHDRDTSSEPSVSINSESKSQKFTRNITMSSLSPTVGESNTLSVSVLLETCGVLLGYPVVGTVLGQVVVPLISKLLAGKRLVT